MNCNSIFEKCPYCYKNNNIVICGDFYRCLNHDVYVWFDFTKRIIGYDGYCVEICFLDFTTKVFKCPKTQSPSDDMDFDYLSNEKKCVWDNDFIKNLIIIRPENFKKFLNKIRTIVVFS